MLHSFIEVSCEGADLKDPPEARPEIASLLLKLHKALKKSDITKYCFENRKKKKESCVSPIRNFVAVAAML
mgnify:CR=1 FL=1